MTKTREQQLERQLRVMEYVEIFYKAAEDKGLYMDHSSEKWQYDYEDFKLITFFIWDASGSISTSFETRYTNTNWMMRKSIVNTIINKAINKAFE